VGLWPVVPARVADRPPQAGWVGRR